MEDMLAVNNIRVVYNDVCLVLKGISMRVAPGAGVALLGSNGAGKTTVLRAIAGILKLVNGEIEEGNIEFLGERIDRKSPEKIVQMGICTVPEGRGVFSELTVMENLKVGAYKREDSHGVDSDLTKVFNYFPILRERRHQLAGYLSGGEQQMIAVGRGRGEQQMIAVGRGLMAKPKLMMLDEPSLGLAPIVVSDIFRIIEIIHREEGVAILLVEQNAKIALELSQYGYIMENGRVVMDATTEVLSEDLDIKEFYLGLTTDNSRRKNFAQVKHYKRRKRWLS